MFNSAWLKTVRGKLCNSRRRRIGRPDEVEVLEPRMVLSAMAFVEGQSFELSGCAGMMPAADLDGDQDLDLIASSVLLRNDGSGHFVSEGNVVLPTSFTRGAFGDVDHDGDLDALIGMIDFDEAGEVRDEGNGIWLNDGMGHFTDSGQRLGTWMAGDLALADLDSDGDLDAFAVNTDSGIHTVWFNDGTGLFEKSGQNLRQSASCETSVVIADFDGDGDSDAFTGMNSGTRLWLNDGTGRFTDSGQRLPDSGTRRVSAGDLDADGDLDLYLSGCFGDSVFINDGTGRFTEQRSVGVDTYDNRLGDLDGDGDLDVFLANRNWHGFGGPSTELVLINDGTGHFQFSGHEVRQEASRGVDLADLDGDGDLDGYSPNDWNTRIWINTSGAWSDPSGIVGVSNGRSNAAGASNGRSNVAGASNGQPSATVIDTPDTSWWEEMESEELVSPDSDLLERGEGQESSTGEDPAASNDDAVLEIEFVEADEQSQADDFFDALMSNADIDASFAEAWQIDETDAGVT